MSRSFYVVIGVIVCLGLTGVLLFPEPSHENLLQAPQDTRSLAMKGLTDRQMIEQMLTDEMQLVRLKQGSTTVYRGDFDGSDEQDSELAPAPGEEELLFMYTDRILRSEKTSAKKKPRHVHVAVLKQIDKQWRVSSDIELKQRVDELESVSFVQNNGLHYLVMVSAVDDPKRDYKMFYAYHIKSNQLVKLEPPPETKVAMDDMEVLPMTETSEAVVVLKRRPSYDRLFREVYGTARFGLDPFFESTVLNLSENGLYDNMLNAEQFALIKQKWLERMGKQWNQFPYNFILYELEVAFDSHGLLTERPKQCRAQYESMRRSFEDSMKKLSAKQHSTYGDEIEALGNKIKGLKLQDCK